MAGPTPPENGLPLPLLGVTRSLPEWEVIPKPWTLGGELPDPDILAVDGTEGLPDKLLEVISKMRQLSQKKVVGSKVGGNIRLISLLYYLCEEGRNIEKSI